MNLSQAAFGRVLQYLGSPALVELCVEYWSHNRIAPCSILSVFNTAMSPSPRADGVEEAKRWLEAEAQARSAACEPHQLIAPVARALGMDGALDCQQARRFGFEFLASSPRPPPERSGLAEIHCHYWGALSVDSLWEKVLLRSDVRALSRSGGYWGRLEWGEIYECARALCSKPTPIGLRSLWKTSPMENHHAIMLAIAAAFRQRFLLMAIEPGLDSFSTRYQEWASLSSRKIRQASWTYQILHEMQKRGITSIELRPAMPKERKSFVPLIREVALGYFLHVRRSLRKNRLPTALGLVFSLIRSGLKQAEPHEQAARWRKQVEVLIELATSSPLARWLIAGIDVAGTELGCPPRLLAEALKPLRAYNGRRKTFSMQELPTAELLDALRQTRAKSVLARVADGELAYPPACGRLGVTIHAGEDWDDPLTGLRHVDETVRDLDLCRGERLGHALVLGVRFEETLSARANAAPNRFRKLSDEPPRFAVWKARGTHLLDLAWAARRACAADKLWFASQLAAASTRLLGAPADHDETATAIGNVDAGLGVRLGAVAFGLRSEIAPRHAEWADVARPEILERLRDEVVKEIVGRQLVIESCPTSNRIVCGTGAAEGSALVNMMREYRGLRVAIASDDPGLLNAYLPDELDEMPDEEMRKAVIEEARRASWVRPFVP